MENGKIKLTPEIKMTMQHEAFVLNKSLRNMLWYMSNYLECTYEDITILSGARDIAEEIYERLNQIHITRN